MKVGIINKVLSIVIAFVMCFTLLPTSTFAASVVDNTIKNGYYNDSIEWTEGRVSNPKVEGLVSVNKTAIRDSNDKNKYHMTIEVVTEENEEVVINSAATVLVIDTSVSMDKDNRLTNAKNAAIEFIKAYGGEQDNNFGRWLSIVDFDTDAVISQDWIDVSTEAGRKTAIDSIDSLKVDGATNLHAGLRKANELLDKRDIDTKNTVVLTDGAPTYSIGHNEGGGAECRKQFLDDAAREADILKLKSSIYTVCYGANNDPTYEGGPSVGKFLKNSIATKKANAYNANNLDNLNKVFSKITETIVNGLDGSELEIVDKNAKFVEVEDLNKLPSGSIKNNSNGFIIDLGKIIPQKNLDNGVTTYTFKINYVAKLDADNANISEDKYYPLNGDTYMMLKNKKIKFPIPAVKPVKTRYTVVYTDGVDDKVIFEDQKTEDLFENSNTPVFKGTVPERPEDKLAFDGWNPVVKPKVKAEDSNNDKEIIYTAVWSADENGNNKPDYKERYTVIYTDGVDDKVIFEDQKTDDLAENSNTPAFEGTVPGRPEDKLAFDGWNPVVKPKVKAVNAKGTVITYTAKWSLDENKNNIPDYKEDRYKVFYIDGTGGKVFKTKEFKNILSGTPTPEFGENPTREHYIFVEWTPEIAPIVTKNASYAAIWAEDKNDNGIADDKEEKFTVRYKDGDVILETHSSLLSGTVTPKYKDGKELPDKSDYIFEKWNPEVADTVTKDVDYVAVWLDDKNNNNIPDKDEKYTVKYMDGKTVLEEHKDILNGTATPKYKDGKEVPKKADNVFVEWNPEVDDTVTKDIEYVAIWAEDKNNNGISDDKEEKYTVTYKDGKKVLEEYKGLLKGFATPKYKNGKENPKKPGYTFNGWKPVVADTVSGNVIYTAKWKQNYVPPVNPNKPDSQEPDKSDNPDRVEGNNRIETAIEASKDLYPNGTNVVVIANCERYTDVLTANPFAIQEGASLLFTYKNKLPEKTLAEIERLGAKQIYISGGYDAVAKNVVDQLKNEGYSIYRFDGENRYDTARKIAIKIREKGNTQVAELASGENYPDALSMTPMAVKDKAPILLTKKDSIPMYTKQALADWDIETIKIAGLNEAISADVEKQIEEGFTIIGTSDVYDGAKSVKRFGGVDRYETSVILAKNARPESTLGVYATGENFPDALVAGNYAGRKNAPVLLVKRYTLPAPVAKYTRDSKIQRVTLIGGVNAISDYVYELIKEAIE